MQRIGLYMVECEAVTTHFLRLVVALLLLLRLSMSKASKNYHAQKTLLTIKPTQVDYVCLVTAEDDDDYILGCPDPYHCDFICPNDDRCWLTHDLGQPTLEVTSLSEVDDERYNITLSMIPNTVESKDAATKDWRFLIECPFVMRYFRNYTLCDSDNGRCLINCWWRGSGAWCEPTKDSYWGQGDVLVVLVECYLPKTEEKKKSRRRRRLCAPCSSRVVGHLTRLQDGFQAADKP